MMSKPVETVQLRASDFARPEATTKGGVPRGMPMNPAVLSSILDSTARDIEHHSTIWLWLKKTDKRDDK